MAVSSFSKRLAVGMGAFGLWNVVAIPLTQYNEDTYYKEKVRHLHKDVSALHRERAELRQQVADRLSVLAEELEYGDMMLRGQRRLWEERLRRWLQTEELDARAGILPGIFWHFKRLGKWYEGMTERISQHKKGDYGMYQAMSSHYHDARCALTMDAHSPEERMKLLNEVLARVRAVNGDGDRLLFLLEASLQGMMDSTVSLEAITASRNNVANELRTYAETPDLPKALTPEVSSAAELLESHNLSELEPNLPLLNKRLLAVYDFVQETQNFLRQDEGSNLAPLISSLCNCGTLLEQYMLRKQAQNILDAYMVTMALSFLQPPVGARETDR